MKVEKIGILGGTFDPIHIGHLLVAQDAMGALELTMVIFVPAAVPPHKMERTTTTPRMRLEMVQLAVKGNPSFSVSDIEFKRSGPSFSIDTITRLKNEVGGGSLYFLIGEDNLKDIWSWKEPERLFQSCQVVVIGRPGEDRAPELDDLPGQLTRIDLHRIDLSSSEIRERLMNDLPIRYLVPPEVERYIYENRLYRQCSVM